jgi:hypothetical protein
MESHFQGDGGGDMFWSCITAKGPGYGTTTIYGPIDSSIYVDILETSLLDTLDYFDLHTVNGKMLRVFSKKGFFSHHYLRLSSIRVVFIPNERESVVRFIYKLFETIRWV